MMFSASFLPRVAFAWRASRFAALAPLTHAAAQAGWFEKLSRQKYGFGKVLFTQNSRHYFFWRLPELSEEDGLAQLFKGITTNGEIQPGLYSFHPTGVSTETIERLRPDLPVPYSPWFP